MAGREFELPGSFDQPFDRDILLERLERKLAEKEKELEEMKRMVINDDKIAEIKSEILSELRSEFRKVTELEAKVVELSKTVESLMSEVLYLKAELRKEYSIDRIERRERPEEETTDTEEESEDEGEIIVCD
ncbi:hypothetical protein [Archaeoglobus veneficus]|uniref:Uncharacterized protein n=1 Tax=Archaeoglobus veneficus (strain DSM 11195 / SNP6) TaxID=693661 RepID=F2KNS6_ARCVS|nr:hypothetical protein [Archaeoglobus veneficus]AEA47403.1 hypothetical protein Arcve_1399 [Archaeoglobus veneficus SNP6]